MYFCGAKKLAIVLLSFAAPLCASDMLITIDGDEISTQQLESLAKPAVGEPRLKPKPSDSPNVIELKDAPQWVSLPLEDQDFIIDKTIQAFTLTIDKRDEYEFKLLTPIGETITAFEKTENYSWDKTDTKCTLTYHQPVPGQWNILSDLKRKVVVEVDSLLILKAEPFPNNMLMGQALNLNSFLEFKNKLIRNEQLKYTQFYAIVEHIATQKKFKVIMNDEGSGIDTQQNDGVFSQEYRLHYLPGLYNVTYHAIGLSFKRHFTQQVFVHEFPGKVIAKYNIDRSMIEVGTRLMSPFIKVKTAKLMAYFYAPDGSFQSFEMDKMDDNTWYTEAPSHDKHKYEKVIIATKVDNPQGRELEIQFAPVNVLEVYKQALAQLTSKKREAILASDDFQLGHILNFSREKLAQEYALIAHATHYADKLPKPSLFYQTQKQQILLWWQQGKNSMPTFSVGISNVPEDMVEEPQIQEEIPAESMAQAPVATSVTAELVEPAESRVSGVLITIVLLFMLISFAGIGGVVWILLGKKIPIPVILLKRLGLEQDLQTEDEQLEAEEDKASDLSKPPKAKKNTRTSSSKKQPELDPEEVETEELEEEPEHEIAENLKSPPKPPAKPKGVGVAIDEPQSRGPVPGYQEHSQAEKEEPVPEKTHQKTPELSEEDKQSLIANLKNQDVDGAPKEGSIAATSSIFFYDDDDDDDDDDDIQPTDDAETETDPKSSDAGKDAAPSAKEPPSDEQHPH